MRREMMLLLALMTLTGVLLVRCRTNEPVARRDEIPCPRLGSGGDKADEAPADFGVDYEWRAGSLPPPFHYQFSIVVPPAGPATMVMVPDYPSDTTPRWTESFAVRREELANLYRLMVSYGLFSRGWRTQELGRVGGSNQSLTVTAHGKQFVVQDYLPRCQEALANGMDSAVSALVPKATWNRLQARRQQYVQEHSRK
jgi:hypothetical protein